MKLKEPVVFTCLQCGQKRTGARRRCYFCTGPKLSPESRQRQADKIRGRKQSEEHRRKNSEGHKGNVNRPNLAEIMRGRPPHNLLPVGSERRDNGHTKVKCVDGKWRYRARVVWEQVHG